MTFFPSGLSMKNRVVIRSKKLSFSLWWSLSNILQKPRCASDEGFGETSRVRMMWR